MRNQKMRLATRDPQEGASQCHRRCSGSYVDGRVNLYHASVGDDVSTFVGPAGATAIASGGSHSAGEVAAGATLALTPTTSLYGELGHLWSIGGDATVKSSVQASLGIKVRW